MKSDEDDPYQNTLFRLLGVFAQLEAKIAQQRTQEGIAARQQNDEYHHGWPPLGFEKEEEEEEEEEGQLIEADNYDQVCAVLEMVAKNELSKRKASEELSASHSTISRTLERHKLYGI